MSTKSGFGSDRMPTIEHDTVACNRCRGVYRLGDVAEIVARHADCTVFKAPCCGAGGRP